MIHRPSITLYADQTGLASNPNFGYRLEYPRGTVIQAHSSTGIVEDAPAEYSAPEITISDTLAGHSVWEAWGTNIIGLFTLYEGRWVDVVATTAAAGVGTGGTTTGDSDVPTLDLFMVRGELETFTLTLSTVDPDTGAARDLTAYADLIFTAKHALGDPDAAAVAQKRKGAGAGTVGVLRVDPDAVGLKNVFRVWLNPADTLSLDAGYLSRLRWDARGILAAGNVRQEMEGWLTVSPSATQAVS